MSYDDVLRLEVTMDYLLVMHIVEGIAKFSYDLVRQIIIYSSRLDQSLEAASVHPFHHNAAAYIRKREHIIVLAYSVMSHLEAYLKLFLQEFFVKKIARKLRLQSLEDKESSVSAATVQNIESIRGRMDQLKVTGGNSRFLRAVCQEKTGSIRHIISSYSYKDSHNLLYLHNMHICSRHIISLITALFLTFAALGQTVSERDEKLNRYELACRECLELKSKVNSGEKVPKDEAIRMINAFVAMNAEIKSDSTAMTTSQKARFEAVNRWFSTGQRPKMLDHGAIIKELQPAPRTAAVTASEYSRLSMKENMPAPQKTGNLNRPQFIILADISLPAMSYGLMAGAMSAYRPGRISWGGYAHFNSNFNSASAEYSCTSDGTMPGGGRFWPGEGSCNASLRATGGVLAGINRWFTLYGGIGYGYNRLMWEDVEGRWTEVSDFSYKGISAETGVTVSWNHLTAGLGVSTVSFRTVHLGVSVGIRF